LIKLPEKYYVGIRPQAKGEDTLPLGFATPFGTDSAFEKRKNTVDGWTGKKGTFVTLENTLMAGFRISQSVRRYGWNGGGNVVWRIEDPRGFELEISSGNFASIVDCTTLTNGVIEGKCIWGREGAINVLIPEASTPYQEAVNFTDLSKLSVSSKDLKPGQFVRMKDDRVAMYCGEYFGLNVERDVERRPDLEEDTVDKWGAKSWYKSRIPQTPFYKLKPRPQGKRALFLLEEHVDQFLKEGTIRPYEHSPDYYGYSQAFFSYSGFKTVAKLEPRKEVLDQSKILDLLEKDQSSCTPLFGYASLLSLTAFKEAVFEVVDGEMPDNKTVGDFLRNPSGQLYWIFRHTFHERRYPRKAGDPDDKVLLELMPFDLESFKLGVEQKAIGEKFEWQASEKVLCGWTAVTLKVTANGRSAPLKISSWYSKVAGKSIFEVVPSIKRN